MKKTFYTKGLLALLICASMLLAICGCTAQGDSLEQVLDKQYMVFGLCPDSVPMSFEQDGQPAGLSVDVAELLAEKLDIEARFVFIDPSEVVEALSDGVIDCYVNLASPEIKLVSQLGTIDSGLDYRQVVAVTSDSSISRLVDLTGKTVYCVSGSDAALELTEAQVLKSELGGYADVESIDELIQALSVGECDAIAVDEPALLYATRMQRDCVILDESLASGDFVLAFRLRDTALRERIDLLYEDISEGGSLDNIKDNWLGG